MTGQHPVVAVLGAGSMAGAIAKAIVGAGTASQVRLTTGSSHPEWAAGLSQVTHRSLAEDPQANLAAASGADVVILGVKPHAIAPLAREVAPALAPGALVVSVAGGVTLDALAEALPAHVAAVRTMPNTPVAVGRGITAYAIAPGAPPDAESRLRALLAPTGTLEALDEPLIDGFSAVVGSGPAYVYAIVEALRAAAVEQGLDEDVAARLVPEMIAGSLAYLAASGREPGELREEVTSPGGSTAQALGVFDERGLAQVMRDGVAAAAARARELGRG